MRIHSFLLNFAQKRNKIIQQWTLENLFERLKATIMRNDFLRTIIINANQQLKTSSDS